MNAPRRAFLRGLTTLPLIGGAVTLIGQPTAVAEPVTPDLLEAYKTWLFYEHRSLAWQISDLPKYVAYYGGTRSERYRWIEGGHSFIGQSGRYHGEDGRLPAASRAALVLSTVGCDWRDA